MRQLAVRIVPVCRSESLGICRRWLLDWSEIYLPSLMFECERNSVVQSLVAAEEDFEFGRAASGSTSARARLYTAIARHFVLVMAALPICAVTAAMLRDRTDTQAPCLACPVTTAPTLGLIPGQTAGDRNVQFTRWVFLCRG
jgi:hypothetical protein